MSAQFALIGNAPSSGSTLLADILDSTTLSACGPELGLFSSHNLYERFRSHWLFPSLGASPYCATNGLYRPNLAAYGLDDQRLAAMHGDAGDVAAFCQHFAEHFLALRGRESAGVVFEKTPQNINCASLFLDACPQSHFITIVRHPARVVESMGRRGFDPITAIATWVTDVASWYRLREHPRMIMLRYEDLVAAPFDRGADLVRRLTGGEVDTAGMEVAYQDNRYRALFEARIDSWRFSGHGQPVAGAEDTTGPGSDSGRPVNPVLTRDFAGAFGLPVVDMATLARAAGYEDCDSIALPLDGGADRAIRWRRLRALARRGQLTPGRARAVLRPVELEA